MQGRCLVNNSENIFEWIIKENIVLLPSETAKLARYKMPILYKHFILTLGFWLVIFVLKNIFKQQYQNYINVGGKNF